MKGLISNCKARMLLSSYVIIITKQSTSSITWQPVSHVIILSTDAGRMHTRHASDFYARQLYRQVLLRARISYGDSVCPSVYPSVWGVTTRYRTKPRWDRDSGSSPYDSLEFLVSSGGNLVPLGEEIPLERGHQRGYPP